MFSFVGQAAAFKCAAYMRNRAKVETEVIMPEPIGWDMLDSLNDLITQHDIDYTNENMALLRWAL